MAKVNHIFKVAVQGSRKRVDDRGWQTVGTVAFHALDDYWSSAGRNISNIKAFAPRRVQALLGLPRLSSKETGAIRDSLPDAQLLMEWLTYGAISGAPQPHPSPWPNVKYSNPLFWLHKQTRMINAPPGGRIEFEATFRGLILLSTFFGTCRGTLRGCANCGKLFVNESWYQYRQDRCPSCHKRWQGTISARGMSDLDFRVARQWEIVRRRMWMRLSRNSDALKQWGETKQKAYEEWSRQARAALTNARYFGKKGDFEARISAWERQWAPPVRRGRPPKSKPTHIVLPK